ncbi:flagellar basal body P-ring formation protein FlgA [Sphingomonas sp. AP4-R1]|uniref:flagellar basal body P-ring formation chaperone FlgA n=1 Tax=Sphingomonas sp. AP4-R1 TaxID=2735134 RepID=UPI001493C358|nr:flagellar basal body P-ring formation chaperone FlgA [Sphingomonas sp. AP4-R1]QJU57442.1 flagellar basal body P-ring formation protein FlgA [Sphingomonas sp. AP4-R1]
MNRLSILLTGLLQAAPAGGIVPAPTAPPPVISAATRATERPTPLVKRGDAIVIAVRSGALLITAHGKALSDGAMGDRVRVTNDATRRTLQAVVEGPARVKILTE